MDGNKMLSKLMNIEGKKYEFKNRKELEALYNSGAIRTNDSLPLDIPQFSKGQRYGLIAQEIEKEFPELVMMDSLTMTMAINYDAMIPVLIEAIKEQHTIINSHEKRITQLERKIETMTNGRGRDSNKKSSEAEGGIKSAGEEDDILQNTVLYQNTPNPFNQTTTIRFTIPESVSKDMLYIYNMQGVQINSYAVNERGNSSLEIQGNELEPGMYLYTLIADGKEVGTKRMVLTE